jgi:hypothetical protein
MIPRFSLLLFPSNFYFTNRFDFIFSSFDFFTTCTVVTIFVVCAVHVLTSSFHDAEHFCLTSTYLPFLSYFAPFHLSYSALQESLRTLDLIAESIPEVLAITSAVLAAAKSVKINTEEKNIENKIDSDGVVIIEESVKMDVETVTTEIKPVITVKHLHLLTNNISVLYATNTEFLLLREISDALTAYHLAVSSWSERTAMLIPQKSTRSKMSKDLKTTSKADLEEVRERELCGMKVLMSY